MAKILNLYSGLGGNRAKWGNSHEITAVELNPKIAKVYSENFPYDNVVIADAHKYLEEHYKEYDFIWLSSPCQSHTRMIKATRHNVVRYPEMELYQEIIFLQHFFKGKWVSENVKPYYEPLIKPSIILGRHCFWSNFNISHFETKNIKGFIQNDSPEAIEKLKQWIGIKYEGNIYYGNGHSPAQVLRNCVHPDLGLHILNCASL